MIIGSVIKKKNKLKKKKVSDQKVIDLSSVYVSH